MCKGITTYITECSRKGKYNGYCAQHAHQAALLKNAETLADDEIWEYYFEMYANRKPIQSRDIQQIYRAMESDYLCILNVKYKLITEGEINDSLISLKKIKK